MANAAKEYLKVCLNVLILNKVFNADIVGACNILLFYIIPSPRKGIGVMGRRPGSGPNGKNVALNLPALSRTLAL